MEYTIQQVSKMTGIPSSTLRFYDKAGLLPFLSRGASGYRMFSDLDLGSIQIIQCLKKTGLSIDQIRLFTEWVREGDATLEKRRELFRQQKKEIESRIKALEETLDVVNYKCAYYDEAIAAGTEKSGLRPRSPAAFRGIHPCRPKRRGLKQDASGLT